MNRKSWFYSFLFSMSLIFLSTTASAQMMPYVGFDAGLITLSSGAQYMFNPLVNLDGWNGRLFAGSLWGPLQGFQYGVEFDGMSFSHATFSMFGFTTAYRGYSLSVLGIGKYVFGSGFFLLGKGGVAYLYEKNNNTFTWGSVTYPISNADGSRTAPEVAIGTGYQFTKNFEVDLTADSIFAGRPYANSTNPVAQTNTANIGFSYHFG